MQLSKYSTWACAQAWTEFCILAGSILQTCYQYKNLLSVSLTVSRSYYESLCCIPVGSLLPASLWPSASWRWWVAVSLITARRVAGAGGRVAAGWLAGDWVAGGQVAGGWVAGGWVARGYVGKRQKMRWVGWGRIADRGVAWGWIREWRKMHVVWFVRVRHDRALLRGNDAK